MWDQIEGSHSGDQNHVESRARRANSKGLLAFAACGLLAASASRGQNLLPNAGFNTNISGWSSLSPTLAVSWSGGVDAKGSSGSGSLQMTDTAPTDNNSYDSGVFFCVAVTAGLEYHLGGSFYFPAGQSHGAQIAPFVFFYSSSNCSTGQLTVVGRSSSLTTNTWQRVDTQPVLAPGGAASAFVSFGIRKVGNGGSIMANLDDAVFEAAGANLCFSSDELLCLGSRFTVATTWSTGSGSTTGHAVQLTSDTGYFWFFSPSNIEMVVKALDACSINSRKWVFAGGLTNVNVVSTVRDLRTGAATTYTNPLNTAFQPVQDTSAFATCP